MPQAHVTWLLLLKKSEKCKYLRRLVNCSLYLKLCPGNVTHSHTHTRTHAEKERWIDIGVSLLPGFKSKLRKFILSFFEVINYNLYAEFCNKNAKKLTIINGGTVLLIVPCCVTVGSSSSSLFLRSVLAPARKWRRRRAHSPDTPLDDSTV